MEIIIRCVILSFLLSVSCKLFFDTLLPKRSFRFRWLRPPAGLFGPLRLRHLALPTFMAGLLLIAFTPIPPFIFQPVRFVLVILLTSLLYYEVSAVRSLAFSILLCSIYWITSAFLISALYLFPPPLRENANGTAEYITDSIFLCLILVFHFRFKGHSGKWLSLSWFPVSLFPLLSIIIILSASMISERSK